MKRHCPSAKSVSKAREDLPEPETPVTTVRRSWGSAREMFFRLFWRAPWIRSHEACVIRSHPLRWDCTPGRGGRRGRASEEADPVKREPLTGGPGRRIVGNDSH